MSDQEKKSGGGGGSSAVIVDQTPNSRHKPPYRPTDIQDDTDLHHKHSRAPAVQSVAEELKNLTQETTVNEISDDKEQKDHKRAISSEMNKQSVAKKLSSSPKKRNSSPESMILASVEVDTKKGSITPPTQPIPQDVEAVSGADFTAAEKEAAKKADTDSITEEISEGRTVEPSKKYSNWSDDEEEAGGLPRSESRASRVSRVVRQFFCCGVPYEAPSEENISSGRKNKREISREDNSTEEVQNLPLDIGTKSQAWILERRPSVGPCFRPGLPFEGPTGITIHMPRKSIASVRSSGININISRKSFTTKSKTQIKRENKEELSKGEIGTDERENKIFWALKEKVSSMHNKIKNVFNC